MGDSSRMIFASGQGAPFVESACGKRVYDPPVSASTVSVAGNLPASPLSYEPTCRTLCRRGRPETPGKRSRDRRRFPGVGETPATSRIRSHRPCRAKALTDRVSSMKKNRRLSCKMVQTILGSRSFRLIPNRHREWQPADIPSVS